MNSITTLALSAFLTAIFTAAPFTAQAKSVNGKSVNGKSVNSKSVNSKSSDTLTVRIKGMRCSECGHKVKTALRQNPAIGALDFNYERRTVRIAYDAQQVTADSIYSLLAATRRYKATPYSPTDVIRRGYGQRIADMHCRKCADRITSRLMQIEGMDSVGPKLDKHYIFIRYDANRTSRADIRRVLNNMGYTPCNYYTSPKIEFGYYLIPAEQATQETMDAVLALDGVEDVNANPKRKAMAVTFFNDETTADRLLADIRALGIKAELPKPHVCSEEQAGNTKN